jgi:PAS domain S-box-containing protein
MQFTLTCDASARILSILFSSDHLQLFFKPGVDLIGLLEKGSREKFTHFLQTVSQQGFADGWEVFFELDHESHYALLYGISSEGVFHIAAAQNHEDLRQLADQFFADSLPEQQGSTQPGNMGSSPPAGSRPDQVLFDDIGALYTEMATLQRELSKKQVQLENLNQTISDYAANLEQMVAEKTQELSASEAKFRGVFENSSLGIAIADISGNVIICNSALKMIIGHGGDEICIQRIPDFFFSDEPEQFTRIMSDLQDDPTHSKELEKHFQLADRNEKWVNINIFTLQLQEEDALNIIYIIEDITRRKQNEQALLQAEKLSAVGKLAASLAHEINNPLQAIMGYLGLAAESLPPESPVGSYLDIAAAELKRISVIVADLRAASRKPQIKEKVPSELGTVLQSVVNLTAKKAAEKHIQIACPLPDHLPLVLMDSAQIQQVLLNLVINSMEAIGENGHIQISSGLSPDRQSVEITVEDDGSGFPTGVLDQIFEPFFTTKKEGIGLGLYICREIIKAHGGELTAQNKEKSGARFAFFLPAA